MGKISSFLLGLAAGLLSAFLVVVAIIIATTNWTVSHAALSTPPFPSFIS
ncbi:MAG TPA: hypothetical protein VF629_14250 [Hymenobacter sp.]